VIFGDIHLLHRDGAFSLVEKYAFANHPRKRAIMNQLLSESQRRALDGIKAEFNIQLPDLLVYAPDGSRWWFAEVKGPVTRFVPSRRPTIERFKNASVVRSS
jgi:hypothetical protein